MPPSPQIYQYSKDDHLRHLLDQRTARADVVGRFSAISECSDTPSVYSRAQFSPGPSDNGDHIHDSSYLHTASFNARPNDSFSNTGSSMLDLDYDPRTSYAPSEDQGDNRLAYDDEESAINEPTRMSYLGPKMRFHSRAPWEMDDAALDEEDEIEENYQQSGANFPFARSNASKTHIAGPSSPRPIYATSRPSGESSRSQVPPKRSFETINSQISYPRGALYALAQESLSATSLGRLPAIPPKETLRNKFSFGRLRPDAPTGSLPNTSSLAKNARRPPSPTFDASFQAGINFPSSYKNLASSEHAHMHPYANPDLVVSYADDYSPSSSLSQYAASRNDSSATVTGTFSMDSITKSSTTLTPDSSVHSFKKNRASSILSKNISSPVPVPQTFEPSATENLLDNSATSLPPNISSIAGWTERNTAPSFSLISLEEARAQRVRTATSHQDPRVSSSSRPSNISGSASPTDADSFHVHPESDTDNSTRSRGRSMSAGAKARNAIHTIVPKVDRRDTEPPPNAGQPPLPAVAAQGKTLKHKKSGFMRLFNGNKNHEKDDEPPPVPLLPDTEKYQAPQRTPRSNVQRIPVPSLSPSLYEVAASHNTDTFPDSSSWKSDLPSPKRAPPVLSINTVSSVPSRSSTSTMGDREGLSNAGLRPWTHSQPHSAPANMPEFPALRLRPVSTLFSAHFGDHIMPDSRSSEETSGLETPRSSSPSGLMSPLSPVSLPRTSSEKVVSAATAAAAAAGASSHPDSQVSIKNLQKQLATCKVSMQRQIWELEGQVRDLKAELEDTKGKYGDHHCASCGRGKKPVVVPLAAAAGGVVNRPRARTGTSSRFAKGYP